MAELIDSGNRKEFSTGAVRDIHEGKGRCDLLPLDVIDQWLFDYAIWETNRTEGIDSLPETLTSIDHFMNANTVAPLYLALCKFVDEAFCHDLSEALLELAKHYEDGAKKYSDNNWKLGIDLHCYIDSAIRHYIKWLRGDDDEPHARAVLWNLVGAIWTFKHKPELDDIHPKGNPLNIIGQEALEGFEARLEILPFSPLCTTCRYEGFPSREPPCDVCSINTGMDTRSQWMPK